MATKTAPKETKEQRAERLKAERLESITSALSPVASKVGAVATRWVKIAKQNTKVRIDMGDVVGLMMTTLVGADYPLDDRESAILDYLATLGVHGFSFKTVESWGKAHHAYSLLNGVTDDSGVVIRDELPLYTLIDLSRISSKEDDPTGGLVNVAKNAWASGARTDDELRAFVRQAKRDASGWQPPKALNNVEMAEAIAKSNSGKYPVPVLTPENGDDGQPLDEYRVTLADLVEVATFGAMWRGNSREYTQKAYRTAFDAALAGPEPDTTAPVADGSGATDADAAAAIAAAEALAAAGQ